MSEYCTSDLNTAAFILARGYGLLGMEPVPGTNRRVFHFPPEAKDEAEQYYKGAQVAARAFANALRDLKARIRES